VTIENDIESFTTQLANRLENDPPRRKGERSRDRIKLATAQVLERSGFHAMRVVDITQAAGSSDGAFYIYFKDKKDVALKVLEDFLLSMKLAGEPPPGEHDPFEMIRRANLNWIRTVRANAGLMRSVFQLSDEDPEFGQLVHSSNRAWYERVAKSVVRHHDRGSVDSSAALFAASALGSMMDELVRRLVVYPDEQLVDFLRKLAPTDDALAAALSVLWFRVLYPDRELPRRLTSLARALRNIGSKSR
jgi:AcrR family transcriptional regulator